MRSASSPKMGPLHNGDIRLAWGREHCRAETIEAPWASGQARGLPRCAMVSSSNACLGSGATSTRLREPGTIEACFTQRRACFVPFLIRTGERDPKPCLGAAIGRTFHFLDTLRRRSSAPRSISAKQSGQKLCCSA
jgi:hypothetical protein